MWKDGEELPSFIKDNIERKQRRQIMEQNKVKALVVKQDAGKLSTYLQARFPKDLANPNFALDFAKWCIAHQLEPVRDCIPYQGNPYICVEWLDRQASEDSAFKGYSYKVYSQQEKEALDFDPKDLVAECQANWDGLESPLVGLGVITIQERETTTERGTFRSPVVATHAQQMLFKRARSAALKQKYHVPAPILEELPYTTVIEAEYSVTEVTPLKGGEKSGEAAGEEKQGVGESGETISSPSKETPKTKKIGMSVARDPSTIKTINELFKACFDDFNMQPDQVIQELGYSSQSDISELPSECYQKIAAVR
ncbi:hypothetical protein ES703_77145 [subsurface metagenome]